MTAVVTKAQAKKIKWTLEELYRLPGQYPLTLAQAAVMINESYESLFNKIKTGEYRIAHEYRSGKIYITKSDLMLWRTTMRVVPGTPKFARTHGLTSSEKKVERARNKNQIQELLSRPDIQAEIAELKMNLKKGA